MICSAMGRRFSVTFLLSGLLGFSVAAPISAHAATHHHAGKAHGAAGRAVATHGRHESRAELRAEGHSGRHAEAHEVAARSDTRLVHGRRVRAIRVAVRSRYTGERFYASSFTDANSLILGDSTAGEDPVVRQAAPTRATAELPIGWSFTGSAASTF